MQYNYVAYNIERGIAKGRIEAGSAAEARVAIVERGLRPLHLNPARKPIRLEDLFPSIFSIGTGELVRFCRELSTMLTSGGGLIRTLEMVQEESRNSVMRRTVEEIRKTIDEGGSLSMALAKHPKTFSPIFVSVVEVGEHTGRLGPALEQMADMLEKDNEAKQKAMRTMMYPMAIMGLSLVTLFVLMTIALPPLLDIFTKLGSELPLPTRMALAMASGLKENYMSLITYIVGAGVAYVMLRKIPSVRYWMDQVQARMPMIGSFTVTGEIARFARTTSMLLGASVPLSTAIQQGLNGCKNLVIREAFADAYESLMSGHGVTTALKRHPILPRLFVQLVMIGEESNSLHRTLGDAANTYQQQLEQRLNALLTMLEPISTLMVGGVVAFIAFSMFTPIYSGMNALK